MLQVNNGQQEIIEFEVKPRIKLISCFLLVTCCKVQVRATRSASVSNHLTYNCGLLVPNLLLRTKVAPEHSGGREGSETSKLNTFPRCCCFRLQGSIQF